MFEGLMINCSMENIERSKNIVAEFSDEYKNLSATEKSKWSELHRGITNTFESFDIACKKPDGTINEMAFGMFKTHVNQLVSMIYQAIAKNS